MESVFLCSLLMICMNFVLSDPVAHNRTKREEGGNREMPSFPSSFVILWQHSSGSAALHAGNKLCSRKSNREVSDCESCVAFWKDAWKYELLCLWMPEAFKNEDTNLSNSKGGKVLIKNFVWKDFFGSNLKFKLKIREPSCASGLWSV